MQVLYQLRHINWATVIFTSALSGQRVNKILETVALASEEHSRRISTATMNMVSLSFKAFGFIRFGLQRMFEQKNWPIQSFATVILKD